MKDVENTSISHFILTDSKPHCVLRAIKADKGDEKHIVVRFRHL